MPQRGRQLSGLLRREPQDAPRGAVEPVAFTARPARQLRNPNPAGKPGPELAETPQDALLSLPVQHAPVAAQQLPAAPHGRLRFIERPQQL